MRALLFLSCHTRLDISFPLNLLERYSSCPARRHWSGVKQLFCYLQGTNMGLCYTIPFERNLDGFADAADMSDPHTGRSQTGYVFISSNTVISWRSVKKKMSTTTSNHAEILAIHEASQECVWLRSVIQHIRESCGICSGQEAPTVKSGDIVVQKIRSSDNLADLFTKALPTTTFKKLVHGIGMQRLDELN
nr:hypothetical protein [Tanacetum cinerariifolium]